MGPNSIKLIKLNRLPRSVAQFVTALYKKRIFVDNLDSGGSPLFTDMVNTGELRKTTSVEEEGVVTLEYGLFIEKKKNRDIFSFSDSEIEEMERRLVEEIESEINIRNRRWII